MSLTLRTARWIGLSSVFVLVAAAAFGAKLWHKTPRDFFLSLAQESQTADPTLPESVRDQPTGTGGSFARQSGGGASPHFDGLPPAAAASGTSAAALGRASGDSKGSTAWGSRFARHGMNGGSSSSGSAALGGLWHAMSPFGGHGGGGGAAATPVKAAEHAERTPKQAAAKPEHSAKPPSSGSSSPSSPKPAPPGISAPATAASAVPAAAASAVPAAAASSGSVAGGLGEHETPLPEVGGGSGSSVGHVAGGGSGLGHGSAPGDVSANPEPGTIALVGTGLLGLIGALRRRKA